MTGLACLTGLFVRLFPGHINARLPLDGAAACAKPVGFTDGFPSGPRRSSPIPTNNPASGSMELFDMTQSSRVLDLLLEQASEAGWLIERKERS